MTKDEMKKSPAVQFLLGVLITIILAVSGFGFSSIEKKLDKSVYVEHNASQIRQDDREFKLYQKMDGKLDELLKK